MLIKQQPKVSVIIPFFNEGKWLAEAIKSVINQSYKNWEAILVDDGSEEESTGIAKKYSYLYPKKIIYKDHAEHINRGVTISRNTGIGLAKGKYIAFLDADDYWLPDKLQNQLELFVVHSQAEMICEASHFWYSWQDSMLDDKTVNVGVASNKLYEPPYLMLNLYPLGEGAAPCPSGIIITKKAFERSGGFEETFSGVYQGYEDQAFLAKIYLKEKVFISGNANNFYRKRNNSVSGFANNKEQYYHIRSFFLNWLQEYIKTHSKDNLQILNLISKAQVEIDNSFSKY